MNALFLKLYQIDIQMTNIFGDFVQIFSHTLIENIFTLVKMLLSPTKTRRTIDGTITATGLLGTALFVVWNCLELFTLLVSTCDGVLSFSNIVTELESHWPGENTMGGTVHNRAIEHHHVFHKLW